MQTVTKGATSQSVQFEILDSASSTGGRKTGLAYNTASLTADYVRAGGSAVAITLATLAAANSTWSSGGFKEIDATNMPGMYRLDVPDAAFATGAESVTVTIKGASGMVQASRTFVLRDAATTDAFVTAAANAILAILGTPAGASMSADIAAGLSAAGIRTAIGLATANLDTQLAAKATASALTTAQTDLTTLIGRLTSARAGYLDNLSAGAVALATTATAIKAVTDLLPNAGALSSLATAAAVAALNNVSTAQVLAQMNAALDAAITELAADPGTTPTTRTALMLLYMNLRNAGTTTATAQTIKNNAGATILTKALSDDGTTFTAAKVS